MGDQLLNLKRLIKIFLLVSILIPSIVFAGTWWEYDDITDLLDTDEFMIGSSSRGWPTKNVTWAVILAQILTDGDIQQKLDNEAGLYTALSDVSQFYEPGDLLRTEAGNSPTSLSSDGQFNVDTDDDRLLFRVGGATRTFDFTGDTNGYVLKSNGSSLFTLQADSNTTQLDALTDVSGDGTADYVLVDNGDGTYTFQTHAPSAGNVILHVRNTTGSTIAAGKFVTITGAAGQNALIALADNTTISANSTVMYIKTAISNGQNGIAYMMGNVTNTDTSAYSDGNPLFLSTSGDAVTSAPASGEIYYLGYVSYANPTLGILSLSPDDLSQDGEYIEDDTIDDDSIDFSDVTLNDFTFDVGSTTKTEFGYLAGVTSAIQTQLNAKYGAGSLIQTEAGNSPTALSVDGQFNMDTDDEQILFRVNSATKTFDFSGDGSGYVFKSNGSGVFSLAAESGGSVILDLADDSSNESTAIGEIATTGDTNSIFTESAADKLLINVGNNWPISTIANGVEAGNSPTTPDADGEMVVDTDDEQLIVRVNGGNKTFDFSGDSSGYVLKSNGSGVFSLAADASGGGGTPNILDLADDSSNESTDLVEIATTGDTNSIFTESAADKLLINLSNNWPAADSATTAATANAGDSATAFFSSGTIEHERGGLEADVSAYSGLVKITGGSTSAVTVTAFGESILDDADEATFKATTNLEIGTDVQAYDADLTTYAGITPSANVQTMLGSANNAAILSNIGAEPAFTDTVIVTIKVIPESDTLATGDGQRYYTVPLALNGWNLTDADAAVYTVSSSGTPTVMIRNVTDTQDMLSTAITIDASEFNSYTAATAPVINGSYDDVATGDRIAVDVDVTGTGTTGLDVILVFTET